MRMSLLNMGEILEQEYYKEIDTTAKTQLVDNVLYDMEKITDGRQLNTLNRNLNHILEDYDILANETNKEIGDWKEYNQELIDKFKKTKNLEGCSSKTITAYVESINSMLKHLDKSIVEITTEDIRDYLSYKQDQEIALTTLDNIRRFLNSFFQYLTLENYINRNPVRKIERIKAPKRIKAAFTNEEIILMRNNVRNARDLAMFEMLLSSGVRVGELVGMNQKDINYKENSAYVIGKGNKERKTYFSDEAKLALREYLESRTDENPALFVGLHHPFNRLTETGVETVIRNLGKNAGVKKAHPHKFRRTMATSALDKGIPIEQVQKLLGHEKVDTTTIYALVNESSVQINHKKYVD